MARRAPLAIAIVSFIGFGCGGSSAKPDGGGGSSAGGSSGTTGAAGQSGNTGTGGAAGTGNTAGSAAPTGSLVFQGTLATLLDLGPPCTMEMGATTDRWCAFFGPSLVMPTNAALFVVNVSKAVAGTSITCGATDPNCLKLTDTFGEEQFHPALFQGDTLVYYDALTGTPFGWRPGMTAGRALAVADATTDLNLCTPGIKGNVIWCLRDLAAAMQTDPTNLILSDLLAGHLDATADPPLARVETVISVSAVDMFSHFEVDFPGGGDTIAWSARSVASGPEVLKMQTLGNDASRVTVASGVNSWLAQPDGSRWYWLSGVSETTGVGTLQSAPFPAGTAPVMVAANVAQYGFPNPTTLFVVDNAKAMTVFTPPVVAAATPQPYDTGVLGFIQVSTQGHAAYAKMARTNAAGSLTGIDLWVKKADGTDACTLTATTDAFPFNFGFTPNGVGAIWIQKTLTSGNAEITRLSDCNKMMVGANAVFARALGNRGVIFLDSVDNATGTATTKLRNLATDGSLTADAPSVISGQVGSLIALASGTTDILIYTVNGGGNDDGVYVRGFGP